VLQRPLPTYPDGFPAGIIAELERRIGRRTLGNKPASGTAIVEELGAEHLRTGFPIVYTSADSVMQIAAHEQVVPLEELYRLCQVARSLLTGEHAVGRVIARPFVGWPGHFVRTPGRHDFGLEAPGTTLLDVAKAAGLPVVGVGKIGDIFVHRGLTREVKAPHNPETMQALLAETISRDSGLVFANLVDFDMLYGHRNKVEAYAEALAEFDAFLPCLQRELKPSDALFITADHGCDPTTGSTDHSREYVPLLCSGARLRRGVDLGTRASFADLGATVVALLGLPALAAGTSFAPEILA
jgi:phosphopentomutase